MHIVLDIDMFAENRKFRNRTVGGKRRERKKIGRVGIENESPRQAQLIHSYCNVNKRHVHDQVVEYW